MSLEINQNLPEEAVLNLSKVRGDQPGTVKWNLSHSLPPRSSRDFWRSWREPRAEAQGREMARPLPCAHPFPRQTSPASQAWSVGNRLPNPKWGSEYYKECYILITRLKWFCDLKWLRTFYYFRETGKYDGTCLRVRPRVGKIQLHRTDSNGLGEEKNKGLFWLPPRSLVFQHNGYSRYCWDRELLFMGAYVTVPGAAQGTVPAPSQGHGWIALPGPWDWVSPCDQFCNEHFIVALPPFWALFSLSMSRSTVQPLCGPWALESG